MRVARGAGGRGGALYLGLFIYLCDWTWQREQSHRLPRGDPEIWMFTHILFSTQTDRGQRLEVRGQRSLAEFTVCKKGLVY